jgi:hypothetical protein
MSAVLTLPSNESCLRWGAPDQVMASEGGARVHGHSIYPPPPIIQPGRGFRESLLQRVLSRRQPEGNAGLITRWDLAELCGSHQSQYLRDSLNNYGILQTLHNVAFT